MDLVIWKSHELCIHIYIYIPYRCKAQQPVLYNIWDENSEMEEEKHTAKNEINWQSEIIIVLKRISYRSWQELVKW